MGSPWQFPHAHLNSSSEVSKNERNHVVKNCVSHFRVNYYMAQAQTIQAWTTQIPSASWSQLLKMFHFYSYSINQSRIVQFEFWWMFHSMPTRWPLIEWCPSWPMKKEPKFNLYNPSLVYTVEVEMKHL